MKAKASTPKHPHDLASHNGLFYQLYDIIHDVWSFKKRKNKKGKEDVYKIKMSGNRASNDGDLVRRWCLSGKGVAVKSCLEMSADLLSGKIVNAMPGFNSRSRELWLVCPSRQSITPAVRHLRDMVKAKTIGILKQLVDKGILDGCVFGDSIFDDSVFE